VVKTRLDSRQLLTRLRDTLAEDGDGQQRLDHITQLVALGVGVEVCSIYLRRDRQTLELCATEGLKKESVHVTRMRYGEGLVGRVAKEATPVNADNATKEKGFRFMPETGEEIYSSFLGVPIQRLGEVLGVLVIQSKAQRKYSEDDVYALEVVAMVIAEMKELGAFVGDGEAMTAPHQRPIMFSGASAQEGAARGNVLLHDPKIVITNPVSDDPEDEKRRLKEAMDSLRISVNDMLSATKKESNNDQLEVMEAYRMFANSKGWRTRMEESIESGLAAEVAVEKEQSATRARMARVPDPYLRERLHDLDDLSNRLLRILTGQGRSQEESLPENAVLVARNIGPGELLEYGKGLRGIILEQGSVGSHATIIARAWAVPMVVHAENITREALNGDTILVDGDQGIAHLRPDDNVASAFNDKIAMANQAQERFAAIREKPAITRDGIKVNLTMNAGLLADLPSIDSSGAEGVGLFRTELQFLLRNEMPKRADLYGQYARVMDSAKGKPVTFRTLDIGSDKVVPFLKPEDEPNPALGWRAIRISLDKPGIMRMQLEAILRAANGRAVNIMFPFVAQFDEFKQAKAMLDKTIENELRLGHNVSNNIKVGAMLETPSLAFAPKQFFEMADFISIGGNDLKQFFFAADRENERVRRRYDTLSVSFLTFIELIVSRCHEFETPVSFCGEDAGRPLEGMCFAAMGLRSLSMRPASIGPIKDRLLNVDLAKCKKAIDASRMSGVQSVRDDIRKWYSDNYR
jgi:phosphotransferase system enzyme I (PtsP)